MAEQPDDAFTFSDVIRNLIQMGVDTQTITHVVNYAARDRRYSQCDGIVPTKGNIATTALLFATELDDLCDRTRGINVAMIGLREVLGDDTCIAGMHQFTIDLADHAQRLKKHYGLLLVEIGIK